METIDAKLLVLDEPTLGLDILFRKEFYQNLLNDYFDCLVPPIENEGGEVLKYMGDGLMASFGTPNASPHDAANAIAAAFEMQARIARLNAERTTKGLETIRLSVGVHYGPVILGDIGNARRMEFAMLGDTVNVASRLEGINKQFGTTIIASGSIRAIAGDTFGFRSLGSVHAKGRKEPIDIYELLEKTENDASGGGSPVIG